MINIIRVALENNVGKFFLGKVRITPKQVVCWKGWVFQQSASVM